MGACLTLFDTIKVPLLCHIAYLAPLKIRQKQYREECIRLSGNGHATPLKKIKDGG